MASVQDALFDVPEHVIDLRPRMRDERCGTHSRYGHGCRCRLCLDAHSVYMREYYRLRRVAVVPEVMAEGATQ